MNIDESGYWKQHVTNSPALLVPKISKTVAAHKKTKLIFPLTHLSFKIIPHGLPLMFYLMIPQSSIEILSMELQI